MGKIHIYEGKLPEAVARDFEFDSAYTAPYTGMYKRHRSEKESALKDAKSDELFNDTLDGAVYELLSIVKDEKSDSLDTIIIANVKVIRKVSRVEETTPLVEPLEPYQGVLDLTIQGISYKQKERKSE